MGRGIFEDGVHDGAYGKILPRNGHFAGLNLGKVQHVVDDAKQGVGALDGGIGELALAAVEPRLREQFNHAEDAAQRRADFMLMFARNSLLAELARLAWSAAARASVAAT